MRCFGAIAYLHTCIPNAVPETEDGIPGTWKVSVFALSVLSHVTWAFTVFPFFFFSENQFNCLASLIMKSFSFDYLTNVSKALCSSFLFFAPTILSSEHVQYDWAVGTHLLVSHQLLYWKVWTWTGCLAGIILFEHYYSMYRCCHSLWLYCVPGNSLSCRIVFCSYRSYPPTLPIFRRVFIYLKDQRVLYSRRRQNKCSLLGSSGRISYRWVNCLFFESLIYLFWIQTLDLISYLKTASNSRMTRSFKKTATFICRRLESSYLPYLT
jgi:hypothetical protein